MIKVYIMNNKKYISVGCHRSGKENQEISFKVFQIIQLINNFWFNYPKEILIILVKFVYENWTIFKNFNK